VAAHLISSRPQKAAPALAAIEEAGRTAMADLRRMLELLRPETGAAGLSPAPGLASTSSGQRCVPAPSGSCSKDTPPAELPRAVRAAADGDALLSPSIARRLIEAFAVTPQTAVDPGDLPELTGREADVPRLVAQGLSNAEIAERLYIGAATVKTHVSRLLTKLDAATRVHLVIHAYESGLVTPGR
jgi:DNA-binding CsgD family transcriptional regulator